MPTQLPAPVVFDVDPSPHPIEVRLVCLTWDQWSALTVEEQEQGDYRWFDGPQLCIRITGGPTLD